jgi:hypothetical protein
MRRLKRNLSLARSDTDSSMRDPWVLLVSVGSALPQK